MAEAVAKIGVISCSGEEIPEGTIARQAVRRVLEGLRPQQTVTLCLPLFLAGEIGERRFAGEHPTITVDGCDKLCAKHGTEKYSGPVSASLVVTDILGGPARGCHRSTRNAETADEQAVWLVAEHIAAEVDHLSVQGTPAKANADSAGGGAGCACGGPSPDGKLTINGKSVTINGLPLIFDHLKKKGLQPGNGCVDTLLQSVKVYHPIETDQEAGYRDSLVAAYQAYCGQNRG
jgi:hypothetical protein